MPDTILGTGDAQTADRQGLLLGIIYFNEASFRCAHFQDFG